MQIVRRYKMYNLALPNVPGTRNIISRSYVFISLFLPYELCDISMLARKTRQYNAHYIHISYTYSINDDDADDDNNNNNNNDMASAN